MIVGKLTDLEYIGVQGGAIEMLSIIKMSQKDYCFFSFTFFYHLRIQQYTRTAVINNIFDPGSLGPLNLIFTNQFK